MSMTKAQVPAYLFESEFYKGLGAGDDDEFDIPQEYFKPTVSVANVEDLAHLLHTMKFWGLCRLPLEIIELFILNANAFSSDEYAGVCKVLLEFDVEFGLHELYQSVSKCANYKQRLSASVQCGREDVLEYVSRFHEQVNPALVKAVAENGHIELLIQVSGACSKLSRRNPFKEVSVTTVAARGHLACLKFLFDKGCAKKRDTCRAAAEKGHLACLKLAHEYGCAWNKTVRNATAYFGHLECLKYTLEHGCPLDNDAACAAAEGGQLECLKYLLDKGVKIINRTCNAAAAGGSIECLKLLQARGVLAWDASCAIYAANSGQLTCLTWLLDEGCRANHLAVEMAAQAGYDQCLDLLLSRGCPGLPESVNTAAGRGHLACLQVLKKFNVPIDTQRNDDDLPMWRSYDYGTVYARSLFEVGYEVPSCTMLYAIESGNVECVEYLCANNLCTLSARLTDEATRIADRFSILKILFQHNCPWSIDACKNAADNCDLESLKFAHENGAPWDQRTTTSAVQHSNVPCLKYALAHGCPCSGDACDLAAERGRLDILQSLHEHGCALTLKTCVAAATYKFSDCLTYAITHGAPVDATVCTAVATLPNYSHRTDNLRRIPHPALQVMERAHELGCPWDERTCAAAASLPDSQIGLLQFLHEHGCPWDASTTTAAAIRAKRQHILTYAVEHGCPCAADACLTAVENGNLFALIFLHENHCPWDERVSRAAAASGRAAILRYCVQNGCPIDVITMTQYNNSQNAISFYQIGP